MIIEPAGEGSAVVNPPPGASTVPRGPHAKDDHRAPERRLCPRFCEAVTGYLLQFSHMGKLGLLSGTREFVLSGTPYILVFRLKKDVVQILSVREGRMQLPPTLTE